MWSLAVRTAQGLKCLRVKHLWVSFLAPLACADVEHPPPPPSASVGIYRKPSRCEVPLSIVLGGVRCQGVSAGAVAFCSSDLPSGEFSVVENANPYFGY